MASINAFWELAAGETPTAPIVRASLRRIRGAGASSTSKRASHDRAWILAGVALLHILFALMLREAMRAPEYDRARRTVTQISFIELPRVQTVPFPVPHDQPVADRTLGLSPAHPTPPPLRSALHADGLQAVTIARPALPAQNPPVSVSLYNPDGSLKVPLTTGFKAPAQRDLLAHRSISHFLPGEALPNSPDFHVQNDPSPQDRVNEAGRILSKMIAAAAAAPAGDGSVLMRADRGLRTSGRDSDPCDDIALDMADVDPDHQKLREQAEERYESNCQGH